MVVHRSASSRDKPGGGLLREPWPAGKRDRVRAVRGETGPELAGELLVRGGPLGAVPCVAGACVGGDVRARGATDVTGGALVAPRGGMMDRPCPGASTSTCLVTSSRY